MAAWKNWPLSEAHIPVRDAGVETIRQQVLALLDECEGYECERLRWRLHTAECARDLWLLRGALFQLLSSQHCQTHAAERINALVPAFQREMPARAVTRV